jgi:hypothetical protein
MATKLQLSFIAGLALLAGCARPHAPDYRTDVREVARLSGALGGGASAAAEGPKEIANPTGWATLKGRFRLSGPVSLPPIVVTKDNAICGNTAPNPAVVLGDDNSLQFVLVYLSTKLPSLEDPWVHPSYADSAKATVEFDQKKCIFLSHVFAMRSTQALKVLNSDTVGHNTNIPAFKYNTLIPAGSSNSDAVPKSLNDPTDVSCSIHPWMSAFIMATPHPYLAVTNEKGEFEIKNIPAGIDLEFRVWQEKVKYVPAATLDGKPVTWPKGKVKIKPLANDETLDWGDIVLDAEKFK